MDEARYVSAEERYEVTLSGLLSLVRWCKVTPRAVVGEMLAHAAEEGWLKPIDDREALRVLGAIIVQHVQQRIDVPEEALRREYTVSRTNDPATLTVRFRAELAHDN
jgi:hypothetical protein